MEIQIGDEVEKYGPNIVVTPKVQSISVPYGNVVVGSVTVPESVVDKIYTIPNKRNIKVLSPKLFGQTEYKNSSLLLVGVFFDKEIQLKKWWNISGALPKNDTNEIALGSAIRTALGFDIGSLFQIKNSTFRIVGVLSETGSVDDYSIFLPLHQAQTLLSLPSQISVIDVGALCKDCPVETIAQQIMDAVPEVKATPVKQAVETRMQAVEKTASFSLLLASVILVVGCLGVMNNMLASVHERIKEIGVLMSLGADDTHLYKVFLLESTFLGLLGGLVGTIVGLISSMLIGPLFMGTAINPTEIPLYSIPVAIILAVSASIAASLYPTWRASKIDPVKALKTV